MLAEKVSSEVRWKAIIVGNGTTGKTSIKRSYFGMEFVDNYRMTLGAKVDTKQYNTGYAMQIWDLAGQPGFETLLDEYFVETHGAIIVFDITNRESFEKVPNWVQFLNERTGRQIPMVLVGNKVDLRKFTVDEVTREEGYSLATSLSAQSLFEVPYIETSAKTGFNIDYVFAYLLSTMETTKKS